MMTQHRILESLQIERFRAFRQLRIERLGQVNLITGKNNVGKSCLLEALWIYAHYGSPAKILPLMEARDEIQFLSRYPTVRNGVGIVDTEQQIMNIKHLFYGRSDIQESLPPVKIGPIGRSDGLLVIIVGWFSRSDEQASERQLRLFQSDKYRGEGQDLALVAQLGAQEQGVYPLARYIERPGLWPSEKKKPIPCVFIPASGLDSEQVASLWDAIALTDLEQDVLTALRIIAPQAERVTLVGEQGARRGRIPIIRTPQFNIPVPLRSMGEGMNRLLGIVLALVNARDGILLIDEIESGLHYSSQLDLWRLVLKAAQRLNVQVFATTHSWDCIAAFQRAIHKDDQGDGLLINLREKKNEPGDVIAVLFDKDELAIVTRENIEVR